MFMHEIKSRTFLVKLEETCVISSKWYTGIGLISGILDVINIKKNKRA
jgi:hypothetical protein